MSYEAAQAKPAERMALYKAASLLASAVVAIQRGYLELAAEYLGEAREWISS